VAALKEILPGLKDADRARVPALICRVEGSATLEEGLSLLREMVGTEGSDDVSAAAVAALGRCGGARRGESVEVLLATAGNAHRGEAVRALAAQEAAALANSPEIVDRLLEYFRAALSSEDEPSGRMAVAGLIGLGRPDALRPAALLAGLALRTPPDDASRAAEEALHRMFDLSPGRVTAALREVGAGLPEEGQERAYELFQRLKPQKRDRILRRWRESLSVPGAKMTPEIQAEMSALVDDWPGEILDLVEPVFEASREEERIRMLELLVDLGRLVPGRVLPLLSPPDGASRRLAEATREALAATLARKVLADPAEGAEPLLAMTLDPADSDRRDTGRLSLWLLAWENPSLHDWLYIRIRAARNRASVPLRVELGRWLAQIPESGLRRIPVAPERDPEPRRARFLPGTSGGSGQSP
jgi:hypothetical protein